MIAAIYARKSTEQTGVANEDRSVTRQIEHGKAYALMKGWTVADEHANVDDGIFGADFLKRPRVRQDILDSAILHSIHEALDERILEASVAEALKRLRAEQPQGPDQRSTLERELSLIQTRLHHLVELAATGKCTDAVITVLHEKKTRKKVLVGGLDRLDALTQPVSLDEKRLAKDLRSRLGDIPTLLVARHIPQARQMLRKLLDENIVYEPIVEDGLSLHRNRNLRPPPHGDERGQPKWWRRGELNPCPKIVNASDLHV